MVILGVPLVGVGRGEVGIVVVSVSVSVSVSVVVGRVSVIEVGGVHKFIFAEFTCYTMDFSSSLLSF